jgi:hypothetical protein
LSEIPIIHGSGLSNPRFWGVHGDVYGWRLNAAFEIICAENYPVGMILWLERSESLLHDRLTRSLPEKITAAWNARVPFDQFDDLCGELEATHEQAIDLYRQHLRLPAPQRKAPE